MCSMLHIPCYKLEIYINTLKFLARFSKRSRRLRFVFGAPANIHDNILHHETNDSFMKIILHAEMKRFAQQRPSTCFSVCWLTDWIWDLQDRSLLTVKPSKEYTIWWTATFRGQILCFPNRERRVLWVFEGLKETSYLKPILKPFRSPYWVLHISTDFAKYCA